MGTLVRHAMTEAPTTLDVSLTANDAAGVMAQRDVGAVPVTREGRLVGLVTDRDLVIRVLAARQDPQQVPLSEIASGSPVSVTPDTDLRAARALMAEHQIRRLPVMKGDELVGIISLGDVALASASEREVGETLEEISRSESTQGANEGPTRGTPDRVRDANRDA